MARFFVYIANHFAGKTFPKTPKTIRKRHLNRWSGSTFANDFTYKLFNHFNSWTIIWPSISVSALIVHVKCASAIIDLNNSLFVKCNPFEITFDRLSQQVGIRYFCRSTRVPAMWYQRQMSNKTRDICRWWHTNSEIRSELMLWVQVAFTSGGSSNFSLAIKRL